MNPYSERLPNTNEKPPYGDKQFLKEKKAYRINMDIFKRFGDPSKEPYYNPSELVKDVEHAKNLSTQWEETNPLSDLAEATIALLPADYGWLDDGEKEHYVDVSITAEPDDMGLRKTLEDGTKKEYKKVDGVKEICFKEKGKIIRWGEDVTRRHPSNPHENDEGVGDNEAEIIRKVAEIERSIKRGESPGEVHYFSSVASEERLGREVVGPMPMPKAIICISDEVGKDLRVLHYEVTNSKNGEAEKSLREHSFREEYLAQIKEAMEFQIKLAQAQLIIESSEDRRARLNELITQAREVHDYIVGLMKDKNARMQNVWLRNAYQRTIDRNQA